MLHVLHYASYVVCVPLYTCYTPYMLPTPHHTGGDTGGLSHPGAGALSSSKCPLLPAMVAAKDPRPGSEPLRRADCATIWPWRAHGLQ